MTSNIRLEREAQALIETMARSPFLFDPQKGRIALDKAQSGQVGRMSVEVEHLTIAGSPRGHVSLHLLRPQNAPDLLPAIVYIHGARWIPGNEQAYDRLLRELAVGAEAAVLFPHYSLSPEAKYPTAIEESYAVVKWVAEHGREHDIDPRRLAVAGDCVGGNMTAAVTLLSRERGGPCIQLQVLFYPMTSAAFNTESYYQFAEGYYLRRDEMMRFWDQYTTNRGERNEITASPLRASIEQLKGLPSALVITAEADVLRDEGEAYASRLREAGIRVTAVRFQGIIHDFVTLNALANTAAARGAIALATTWLREGFSTRPEGW